MSKETVLQQLLSLWDQHRAEGRDVPAAELCREQPDLLSELQRRIDLLAEVRQFARRDGNDTQAEGALLPLPPGVLPQVSLTTAEPAPPAAAVAPLWVPPGYEILGKLGEGGMGVVYKARQRALKRLVALKMIVAGGHASPTLLSRFKTEAEAIARLQHPGFVQIHEVEEHQGLPYFSMEYCPGGSLAAQLQGTPVPAAQAAALVEKLAVAMQAAHDKGVIHRDLKPANVLLAEDGTPKITDFGLAKKLDEAGQTHTGAVMGTPSYMAPEQARGDKGIGTGCDVYALGAILYELLTGRPPFKAATPLETVYQVVSDEAAPPRQLNAQVPRDLETICLKCLEKEPRKRYAGAQELAADLGRYLAGEPVHARPVRSGERAWKWAKRQPALASLFAVIVLAALALLGGGLWFTAQLADERNQAIEARNEADAATTDAEHARDAAQGLAVKEQEARQAVEREKTKTEQQLVRSEWLLYASQIALAQREWQDGDVQHARDLLDACRRDLRGWEHAYLRHLFDETQQTFRGHAGEVTSVSFSPDGKRLASASRDKTVKVWERQTGQEVLTLQGHTQPVLSVCFSRDGKRIASASYDGTVKVWDAQTGQDVLTLKGHAGEVRSVSFSPDGKRLASAGVWDRTVKVWDAQAGQEVLTLKGHPSWVLSVSFSPDGKRLASTSADQTVKVWDTQTGQDLLTLKGHAGEVTSVSFNPEGTRLASASGDKTVKIWDTQTGHEVLTLKGHAVPALSVSFSPDGRRVASASADQTVKVWDTQTGQDLLTLKGHAGEVTSVSFSPDGKHLASASRDKTVKVWDTQTGQDVLPLKGHTSMVTTVSFSPEGKRLASASADWTVKVWDAQTGQDALTLKGHAGEVRSVCFSPDGKRLASASIDGTVKVWDAQTGQDTLTLKGHTRPVNSVSFSPDGKRLASASDDMTVKVWDAQTGQDVRTLKGHTSFVSSVSFSPDGTRLASASADWTVKVWDAQTGQDTLTLKDHAGGVRSVCFSPDGKRLASASYDQTVKMWDASTGQEVLSLKGHAGSVSSVCFSPDGKRLASASSGELGKPGEVKVWDAASGQNVLTLKGHAGEVSSVCFSPEGKRLATASGEWIKPGEVEVWDAQTGQDVLTLRGHTGFVTSVSFSPEGKRLASASWDSTVKVWDAATGKDVLTLKGHTSIVFSVSFSPDGKHLASASQDGTVKVWDAHTGQDVLTLKRHVSEVRSVSFSPDSKRIITEESSTDGGRGKLHAWDMVTGKEMLPCTHAPSPQGQLHATSSDGSLCAVARDTRVELYYLPRPDPRQMAERQEVQLRKQRLWHEQQAQEFEQARQWFAAAFHLDQLLLLEPGNADLYARRGAVRAEQGRWDQAVADLARASALEHARPADPNQPGRWRMKNGELLQEDIQGAPGLLWSIPRRIDFTVECEGRAIQGDGELGFFLRAEPGKCLFAVFGGWGNHFHGILAQRPKQAQYQLIASQQGSLTMGRWYRIRIEVRGKQHKIYLDDHKLFEFVDEESGQGRIGLRTYRTSASFRRFRVMAPPGKVLQEGLPRLPPSLPAKK
jgi:WD40 repeat protein